jgi:chemotaxis protein methyltransferase CheR
MGSALASITDVEFAELTGLIRERTGVFLPPGKKPLLVARLLDRIHALGLTSFAEYHKRVLADGTGELSRMTDAICTNETRFFRDVEQLDHIAEHLLPGWLAAPAPRPAIGASPAPAAPEAARRIRVWSAGCSSGEEAFSVAMVLLAKLPAGRNITVEVLGTDISSTALERARAARWPASRVAEIPEGYRRRFLVTDLKTEEYEPSRELRAVVRFQRLNLCDWYYPVTGKFDLILCRNVLIYFDAETRATVARRLVERLSPRGALVLGMSESLLAIRDRGLRTEGAEQELAPGLPPVKMVGPAVYVFSKVKRKKF